VIGGGLLERGNTCVMGGKYMNLLGQWRDDKELLMVLQDIHNMPY
jgi:hypothetical protein